MTPELHESAGRVFYQQEKRLLYFISKKKRLWKGDPFRDTMFIHFYLIYMHEN